MKIASTAAGTDVMNSSGTNIAPPDATASTIARPTPIRGAVQRPTIVPTTSPTERIESSSVYSAAPPWSTSVA